MIGERPWWFSIHNILFLLIVGILMIGITPHIYNIGITAAIPSYHDPDVCRWHCNVSGNSIIKNATYSEYVCSECVKFGYDIPNDTEWRWGKR